MAQNLAARGFDVTVCVATRTGMQYLEGIPDLRVLAGRMDEGGIISLIGEGFTCCIDATHPYAVEASAAIRGACRKTRLPLFRLLRKTFTEEELKERVSQLAGEFLLAEMFPASSGISQQVYLSGACQSSTKSSQLKHAISLRLVNSPSEICVRESCLPQMIPCNSAGEACAMLLEKDTGEEAYLLTTGAKEAACFAPLARRCPERVFLRVLPGEESIRKCAEAGFLTENILTGRGPYTVEENVQVMKVHRIRFLVTKDGGAEGGYPEKLAAAWLLGAKVILIRRPEEKGMDAGDILRRLCSAHSEA